MALDERQKQPALPDGRPREPKGRWIDLPADPGRQAHR